MNNFFSQLTQERNYSDAQLSADDEKKAFQLRKKKQVSPPRFNNFIEGSSDNSFSVNVTILFKSTVNVVLYHP